MYHLPPFRYLLSSSDNTDPSAKAYFAAAGITSPTERKAANTFIVGLKNAGLWTGLDRLYLCSPTSQAAALYCAKSLTQMTAVNSPTYATTGFTFNGTSSYLNTGAAMNTLSSFVLNSSHVSAYARTSPADTQQMYFGTRSSGSAGFFTYRFNSTSIPSSAHGATLNTTRGATNGLVTLVRSSATDVALYVAGTSVSSSAANASSGSPSTKSLFYGALNDTSSIILYGAYEWAGGTIGAGFTAPQNSTLNTLWQAYQTALGRAV